MNSLLQYIVIEESNTLDVKNYNHLTKTGGFPPKVTW